MFTTDNGHYSNQQDFQKDMEKNQVRMPMETTIQKERGLLAAQITLARGLLFSIGCASFANAIVQGVEATKAAAPLFSTAAFSSVGSLVVAGV